MRKTSAKTSDLVPQKHGGALRQGNPGNRGGGRLPDEFRAKMRELATLPEVEDYFGACIKGEHGPEVALKAKQYADERGYGKEPSVTKVTGDETQPLVIKVVKG